MADDPLSSIDAQLLAMNARLNILQTAVSFLMGDEEIQAKLPTLRALALVATDAALAMHPQNERLESYRKLHHSAIDAVFGDGAGGSVEPPVNH
jgi:hypothetical protein